MPEFDPNPPPGRLSFKLVSSSNADSDLVMPERG